MATHGHSGELVQEDGMYLCDDGCERRHYRQGERFLPCAVSLSAVRWTKIEEQ